MQTPSPLTTSSTAASAPGDDGEAMQLVVQRAELAARIERFLPHDGVLVTPFSPLRLIRTSHTGEPTHTLYRPAICLLAQGRKRVLLGDELTVYDALNYLVISQDLPVSGQVVDVTPEAPYLCFCLDFEPRDLAALMLEIGCPPAPPHAAARGLFTGVTSAPLLDAVLRLMRLLDTPQDLPALAPLIVREILYRLLSSELGWRLAQIATPDSQGQRITRAIAWLRERYREPLKIDDMARAVHMSASSLHHHFKAVTAMSPLQYQKQLRLQEARSLMMSEAVDAANAGHRVGYDSASQFSREYARLSGAPPARDMKRLREQAL
ncbi:MAG TPA: AraC family transcriptional regulator [Ideonella sp.]|nr:AraC family transcriptional regulator [Ideonella sp.]